MIKFVNRHPFWGVIVTMALVAVLAIGKVYAHPAYNNLSGSSVPLLEPGQVYTVWNAETPTPGNGTTAATQQVQLRSNGRAGDGSTPFSVDGKFSGAPGTFEVDVQVASTDADTSYQTCSGCNITTVDSTNNTFHLDFTGGAVRYVRLLMRSRGNSVSVTATVSR